tara:strand:- start:363 stop:1118 length:756 start_codon:yes stop_codon:yes gene_type:complete
MALQTTGTLSINEIHIEAGGSSGTTASLNDSDIRGLTPASGYSINTASGTTISIGDFYGASSEIVARTVAGSSGGVYPYTGAYVANLLTSSQSAVGTLPSGFSNQSKYISGVKFYGWAWQSYPAYGSPVIKIWYDTGTGFTKPQNVSNLTIQFRNITDSVDSVVLPMNSSDFSSAQTAGTVPSGVLFGADATIASPYSGSYSNARSINYSIFSKYTGSSSTSYNAFNGPNGAWSTTASPASGETIDLFWET